MRLNKLQKDLNIRDKEMQNLKKHKEDTLSIIANE